MNIATALTKNNDEFNSKLIDDPVWTNVKNRMYEAYGEATFKNWLSKLSFISRNDKEIILGAPTKFLRDWIYANYANKIKRLWKEFEENIYAIDIQVAQQQAVTSPAKSTIDDVVTNVITNANEILISANLDPKYTFKNFVVGKPNEFAYAAALSVAESSEAKSEFNPLFLYGGVGLGKTHLMHAIAWHIKETNPNRKVIYLSAEKFMYQFVLALRKKDVMSFKELFRSVDVLMIDDVQFICGKDSTQEEFFHTFNALFDQNRQVVISADRSPSDLEGMEDRIKSRLGWGLVADVHSTNYELRLGIIQAKAEVMNVNIPKSVMEFLASKITSNVRELEGSLNKIIAHSSLVKREITLESTQDILKDLLKSNEKIITIEQIQKKVAEHFNVKLSDMYSSRRQRNLARPRQVAMYLSKILTAKSLQEIGKKFGGKDHTTVIHAFKTVEKYSAENAEFKEDVDLLVKILRT